MGWMAASARFSWPRRPRWASPPMTKPTPKSGPVDQRVLKAEKAAATTVDAALEKKLAKINKRIANHAEKTGYKGHLRQLRRRQDQQDRDPDRTRRADVLASVLGADAKSLKVDVRKTKKLKDSYSRKSDVPSYWGGAGVTASYRYAVVFHRLHRPELPPAPASR